MQYKHRYGYQISLGVKKWSGMRRLRVSLLNGVVVCGLSSGDRCGSWAYGSSMSTSTTSSGDSLPILYLPSTVQQWSKDVNALTSKRVSQSSCTYFIKISRTAGVWCCLYIAQNPSIGPKFTTLGACQNPLSARRGNADVPPTPARMRSPPGCCSINSVTSNTSS